MNILGRFPGAIAAASAAVAFASPLAFGATAAHAQGASVGLPPAQVKHFDPKGSPPSKFTLELRKGVTATLPFSDKRDFEEAKKGFIAEFRVVSIPFGADHWREAVAAYSRFGRGRSPAALNFGDCLSYAVARLSGEPLLCVGDDFTRTDLPLVEIHRR